jgi:hypothetical protein
MDIHEAIEHAETVANSYNDTVPNCDCARHHRQLAGWLRQLIKYEDIIRKAANYLDATHREYVFPEDIDYLQSLLKTQCTADGCVDGCDGCHEPPEDKCADDCPFCDIMNILTYSKQQSEVDN